MKARRQAHRLFFPLSSTQWGVGILFVLVITGILCYTFRKKSPYQRTTIAVIGEKISVISWDRKNNSYLVISMPQDMRIEAIHGYGMYSVGALWKLDQMERFGGKLFSMSLGDAIGVPIDGVLETGVKTAGEGEPISVVKQAFSFPFPLPLGLALDLWWGSHITKISSVSEVDINEQKLYSEVSLSDETVAKSIDLPGLSLALGTKLEDEEVRGEALRVAVYNGTDLPGLGASVARQLSTMGMFVVVVGNDEKTLARCQIMAGKEFQQTHTFTILQELYNCKLLENGEDGRADVTIHLGREYAGKFKPKER